MHANTSTQNVRITDRESVKLEHVHHAHLRDRATKELGPLVDARADQQTAVRTALNRNARGRRVALGDQVLGRRLKVCAQKRQTATNAKGRTDERLRSLAESGR